jgi:hypothetical protein
MRDVLENLDQTLGSEHSRSIALRFIPDSTRAGRGRRSS